MTPELSIRDVAEEDLLRAHLYGLLAKFFSSPVSQADLDMIAALSGDDTPMGRAFEDLAAVGRAMTPEEAEDEYNNLFIGITLGEVVPYASYHITGHLNDKPLSKLRQSLGALGIARADDVKEPEDHIAFICETLSGMIIGAYGVDHCLNAQKDFFTDHLEPWAGRFFSSVEQAPSARLYKPLAVIGRLFVDIESSAFKMAPH